MSVFRVSMLLFAVWCLSAAVWVEDDEKEVKDTMAASEECLDCHEDVNDVLNLTVHTRQMQVNCISCHGVTAEHLDDPDVGNISNGLGLEAMKACNSCHASDLHQRQPGGNMHATAGVACSDCHAIHKAKHRPEFPLLARKETDLCLSCHQDLESQLDKPFTHKLQHGAMSCSSCHNPHGARGEKGFQLGSIQETCESCHTHTRGPFVFSHVSGFAGDCMSCHESHGSSNPRQLLRANVSQLCLECHSTLPATTFGSQPPATHNLRAARYQNCTTCHTAVHGSSRSPLLLK